MIVQSQTSSSSFSFADSSSPSKCMRTASPFQKKEMEYVDEHNILDSDILCGKNKKCFKHPGSRDFRTLINGYSMQYYQAQSRQEKMDITQNIYDLLENHRFLKFDERKQIWRSLSPLAVRDKIGHALRFANRRCPSSVSTSQKDPRFHSFSSVSTVNSYESRNSSFYKSDPSVAAPVHSPKRNALAQQCNMVPPVTEIDVPGFGVDTCNLHGQLTSSEEKFFHFGLDDSKEAIEDLSWILQIPLLEVNPKTKKIYFVQHA